MRESRVWKFLEQKLPSWVAAERFEVVHPPGMSDVFWTDIRTSISGWLELKYCEPDDREFVRGGIPKLKPEQPMFLRRQALNRVPAGILMRVGQNDWYFWRATCEHEWVQEVRSRNAVAFADRVWRGNFDAVGLFRALGCPCEV